jgi:hypothetical protein
MCIVMCPPSKPKTAEGEETATGDEIRRPSDAAYDGVSPRLEGTTFGVNTRGVNAARDKSPTARKNDVV